MTGSTKDNGQGTNLTAGKQILDACCGGRMMWAQKNCPHAVYVDCRDGEYPLCDGRVYKVHPDVVADFRALPFPDATFRLVVIDPPHLVRGGDNSWLVTKYGKLDKVTWQDDLRRGFAECWRVLEVGGTMIVKWSDVQIPFSEIEPLLPSQYLFGSRHNRGMFMVLFKTDGKEGA